MNFFFVFLLLIVFTAINCKSREVTLESTKKVMCQYIDSEHTDVSIMSDDVVFTHMATGEEHHGPDSVLQMLNYMYHVAFNAKAETKNEFYAEGKAVIEADFVGTHIGEFAGIPATNKNVSVPLCVVYDLENNKIKRARVYLEMPVLFKQLTEK
jgi:steroid delta-isomerase-like uncharacterized protein